MRVFKKLWYGMIVDYHLNKRHKINSKHLTLHRYHYEKALHYYEKAYGEEVSE